MTTTTKFNIKKFDGAMNFSLWQACMTDILVQSGLKATIKERDPSMSYANWKKLNRKALSTIHLCLSNNVMQEILTEKIVIDF